MNRLKYPYTWEERRPLIQGPLFFVPPLYEKYDSFIFPGWTALFPSPQPIHIEYCSGNGDWIVDRAKRFPQINWVAVERDFDRVRKIHSKGKMLPNLSIIAGEAYTATHFYLPTESVEAIYINFPDPWPKRRHAKHRLVEPHFAQELFRIVLPKGTATLVTDDTPCAEQMRSVMVTQWIPDPSITGEGYGTSWFEELWRSKGKEIHYQRFTKCSL